MRNEDMERTTQQVGAKVAYGAKLLKAIEILENRKHKKLEELLSNEKAKCEKSTSNPFNSLLHSLFG